MQLANREIPNGWCYAMHGMIVGVEKISEQHVSGYGFTEGHGRLYGFYSGPHYGHWGTGSLYGSSELFGEQRVWTDYEYATRFFIQDSGGRELPVNVFGDHLPIRDGHRVIAIVVRNSSNSDLLFAMINETTSQELSCCRNGELLRHLDIPAYRYVRALGGGGKRSPLAGGVQGCLALVALIATCVLILGAFFAMVGKYPGIPMVLVGGALLFFASMIASMFYLASSSRRGRRATSRGARLEAIQTIEAVWEFVGSQSRNQQT